MSILACLAAAALQQSSLPFSDPNNPTFLAATQLLASNQLLFLNLTGSIQYKGRTTPIVTNVYWNAAYTGAQGTTYTQQVEVETWSNGVMTRRVTGDGHVLYVYDLVAHTYSATSYGVDQPTASPDPYLPSLFNDLDQSVRANDVYAIKLLRQIYQPSGVSPTNTTTVTTPVFLSWMPSTISQELTVATPDPINNQVAYTPSPTEFFYMYNGAPKRTIVFDLIAGSGTSAASLQTVYFNQLEYLGGQPKLTQWQIKPYTGQVFNPTLFQPYTGAQMRGWKAIVASTPYSG